MAGYIHRTAIFSTAIGLLGVCGIGYHIWSTDAEVREKVSKAISKPTDSMLSKFSYYCIDELKEMFGTDIRAKKIEYKIETGNVYFYGFEMQDQNKETMLKVDTLEAYVGTLSLLKREITIHEVKLHGVNAICYKQTPKGKPNFQFVVDKLKEMHKNKKKRTHLNINIRLQDLSLDRVSLHWDVRSLPHRPGWFDPAHFWVKDMRMRIHGDMLEEKTMNVTAEAFHAHEAISRCNVDFRAMRYRTIRGRNLNIGISGLRYTYPGEILTISELTAEQPEGQFNMRKDMNFNLTDLQAHAMNDRTLRAQLSKVKGLQKIKQLKKDTLGLSINLKGTLHEATPGRISATLSDMSIRDNTGLAIEHISGEFEKRHQNIRLTNFEMRATGIEASIPSADITILKKMSDGTLRNVYYLKTTTLQVKAMPAQLAPALKPVLIHIKPLEMSLDMQGKIDPQYFKNLAMWLKKLKN